MANSVRMSEDQVRVIIDRINKVTGRAAGAAPIEALAAPPKGKQRWRGGPSQLEHMFAGQLMTLELPPPRREFQFMPNRDFRLDYAWPEKKLAVEVNGMVHRIKERFLRDTEKVAYALILGWIVLPLSGDDVRSGRGVSWLVTLWESRQCKNKVRYDSQKAAQAAIGRLRRNTGTTSWMSAYHCRFCGGFHFGHTPYRVRQSMAGLAPR